METARTLPPVAGITDNTAGEDNVFLFDKDSSTPLWGYEALGGGNDVVTVAMSADGEYIVAGSARNRVYLFNKDSSTPLWSYTAGNEVRSVSVSADGKYIAAGSYDDNVYTFQ